MAISSIISFGFGNGTFSPGVAKLPTLGYYQASAAVPTVPGIEFAATNERPHFKATNERPHFKATNERPHFRVIEQ